MFPTLYGKNKDDSIKVWNVEVSGCDIIVRHGKLDGKIQSKVTQASGKNQGKANETTAEEQAVIEAKAKWVKQKKSGYFESIEEAQSSVKFTPMKCQDYKNFSHKVVLGGFLQPKLNGFRCMFNKDLVALSKAGEVYKVPPHIHHALILLKDAGAIPHGLDGEIYAGLEKHGGLSLQKISAAWKKFNADTPKLALWVYDIPVPGVSAEARMEMLKELYVAVTDLGLHDSIRIVVTRKIDTQEEYDQRHDLFVESGFEGSVYRNAGGMYEFDARSYDVIKRKPRQDTEVYVVSSRKDKNGQGVLTGRLESGKEVDFLMLKEADPDVNLREYENSLTLIDTFVTIEFEEYSDGGVPTKPVGKKRRTVQVDAVGRWVVSE